MRTLVIDTETTGLSREDRIVEIAAVELIDNKRTGLIFHAWFNPERESHPRALEIHGFTSEWLFNKPTFEEGINELAYFLMADMWVIHNAPFDIRFIRDEFNRAGREPLDIKAFCTLAYGRAQHTLEKNTLDRLCEIYEVDTSGRVMHGALTDAELLTQLYINMGCPCI